MAKYLKLTSKEKFDILVSLAKMKGLKVCDNYEDTFSTYPLFCIDVTRDGEVDNHIWGRRDDDNAQLSTFEQVLDSILEYKKEHEYHLANNTKAVWKQGDDFVWINGDIVDLSAIKNLITVINTLNQ
jgi:hypothetical protein